MSDWRGLYQNVEQPWEPTKAPATLPEIWAASRTLQSVDNSDANDRRLEQTYAPLMREVNAQRARDGLPAMQNPVQGIRAIDPRTVNANASAYGQATTARVGQAAAQKDLYAYIARVRQTHKDFLPEAGDDPDKLMAGAVAREVKARAAARDTMDRSSGFVAGVVGFAGSASKAVEDPVVIGTLPFGGGGRTLFGVAAREFAVNALTTAVSQPIAAQNRAVVGEGLSLGEAATNIVTAGVAGAAIGGGVHLLGSGVGKLGAAWDGTMGRVYEALPTHLQEKWAGASVLPDEALPEIASAVIGADRFTPDMQAAMHVINRHAEVEAVSPFAAGSRNVETHDDRLAEVLRSIAEANPAPSYRAQLSGGTTLGRGVVPDAAIGRSLAESEMTTYMRSSRSVESSGDDLAKARTSSAFGRYQFTRGTWMRMYVRRFGRQGLSDADILARRSDGATQDTLMRDLTVANAAALRRGGHEPTAPNLRLAHFAGAADAARVLDAADATPLTAVMRAESLAANPHLAGKTVGDLRARMARDVGRKVDVSAPTVRAIEDGADDAARMADLDAESARLNGEALAIGREGAGGAPVRADAPMDAAPVRATLSQADALDLETKGLGPASELSFVSKDGPPGVSFVNQDGNYATAIYRDDSGAPRGIVRMPISDEAREIGNEVSSYVAPELRRQGIATQLYDSIRENGFDVDGLSGTADLTPDGAGFVNARRSRQPLARAGEAIEGDAAIVPADDYDAVAPMLATEGDVAPAARFDADDPVWDAIDRHEADLSMDAIGSIDPTPDPALMAFDDPRGQGAQTQIDSMMHDLRLMAENDPDAMVRVNEDGDAQSLADILDDLEADRAAIAAVQGCL